MVRVIITAVVIVLLAVLVAFNLKFTTTISLFGIQYGDVPVMVVALLSFALGVVYSLFLYVGRYLHQRTRQRLDQLHKDAAQSKEDAAQSKEGAPTGDPQGASGSAASTGGAGDTPAGPSTHRRFGIFRKSPPR